MFANRIVANVETRTFYSHPRLQQGTTHEFYMYQQYHQYILQ